MPALLPGNPLSCFAPTSHTDGDPPQIPIVPVGYLRSKRGRPGSAYGALARRYVLSSIDAAILPGFPPRLPLNARTMAAPMRSAAASVSQSPTWA